MTVSNEEISDRITLENKELTTKLGEITKNLQTNIESSVNNINNLVYHIFAGRDRVKKYL